MSSMRVLILYESRRGFTLSAARSIREGLRSRGVGATIAPIATVDKGTVAAADALIVGSWVEGMIVMKVGPAGSALRGIESLPGLDGLPAVVFVTCDVSPRGSLDVLASRLAAKGAQVVGGHVFKQHRLRRSKDLSDISAFVDGTIEAFASQQMSEAGS
jgi:flavorubredoxin